MADETPLSNLNVDKLREVNKEGKRLEATFDSISKAATKTAQASSKATGESIKNYKASDSVAKKLANNLSKLTKDQLTGLDKRKKFETDLVALESEIAERKATTRNLDSEINVQNSIQIKLAENLADEIAKGDEADSKRIESLEYQIALNREKTNALLDSQEVLQDQQNESQELAVIYREILDTTEEMERINPFIGISEFINDIPILNKVFPGLTKAAEEFNETLVESNNAGKALQKTLLDIEIPEKSLSGFMQGIGKAKGVLVDLGNTAAAFGMKAGVEGVKRLQSESVNLRKELNMGSKESVKLQKSFISLAENNIGLVARDFNQALRETNNTFGTTTRFSDETLKTQATLTKQMGFSADEAGKLLKFSIASGESFEDFTNEAIGTVKVLNAQNDTALDYKDILKDINNTSNAVKISLQGQGYNLAEAAFQAKKMGLSMDKLDDIAGNLLDFEQSIANELEAELLLGRDLNLEKARQAALDGDLVGLGQELQKQGITQEKFASMNRIEQESIAKAMGMSRDSMAEMFVEQQSLANLNKVEGIQADNINDAVKQKYDLIMSGEAEARKAIKESSASEEEKAKQLADLKTSTQEKLDKLITDSGKKELVNQLESQTFAEKQAETQEKIADNLANMFPEGAITGLESVMNSLNSNIGLLSGAVTALTAIMGARQFMGMVTDFKSMFKSAKGMKGALTSMEGAASSIVGSMDEVAGSTKNIVSNLKNTPSAAADVAGSMAKTAGASSAASASAAGATSNVVDDVAKTGAKGGGFFSKAGSFLKSTASKAAGGIKSAAKYAGGTVSNITKNVGGAVSNVASKTGGAISNVAGKLNPKQAISKFLKGPNIGKLLKKLPGIGTLIGPAIETYMVAQAAGSGADPRMVGNQVVNAIGGLGGGILGSILGSAIPVPGIGTFIGGVLGDTAGRYVADIISQNVDTSGLGKIAINAFGGEESSQTSTPQMAEGSGIEVAPEMAADFISRPGQPIQTFRPDDVIIGGTDPMGGGGSDNGRTIELLERLVAAVEKGGVINMDGNKVGTMLGMSSYRTQ